MALTKPPVTSVWASTATDNVTPTDAFIAAGWPQSTTPPSRGRFNWLLNYLYNGVRYFSRRGVADYDVAETYMTNDKTTGPDGLTYISLADNNISNTPASSPTKWARWGLAKSELDALYAALSGNSSQAFNVAAATLNSHALRLDQFTGAISNPGFLAVPFTAGVVRKLYFQFGAASVGANSTLNVNYSTAFPNAVLASFATRASGGSDHAVNASAASVNQISIQNFGTATETINWLSIGW